MSRAQKASLGLLAVGFIGAGVMHFVRPRMFTQIVPPQLPAPQTLVAVSGAAEVLGGVGLLIPRLRKAAGWGLVALLAAVFPANIYMATVAERFASLAPAWVLWARLPLQPLAMLWVWWAAVRGDR
ncbi:DoxX family protein [Rubricoccus marinus]|uniref:DoxX family protein n=1 Tax=Rubricoccus marinus TaxID=716817 RepID=A0A259U0G5_9BACT|nr:DoxX family protein [Rubricoccus marinus]OZC03337.1 hypothetical protein BSZ36_10305 [Rubricoccus marinus]